jgi:hypothetical protein
MVALLGESFLIQANIIRRAPALRKTFSPAPARKYGFLEVRGRADGSARPTPNHFGG